MDNINTIRVAAVSIAADVADVQTRVSCICNRIDEAASQDVALLVLPELCLTSASCADLFTFPLMKENVEQGVTTIVNHSTGLGVTVAFGAPVPFRNKLLDCAIVVRDGKILGIIPKTGIPAWQRRWFTGASDLTHSGAASSLYATVFNYAGFRTVLSPDLTISICGIKTGFEIGQDAYGTEPRHAVLAACGARMVAHLAALPSIADKGHDTLAGLCEDSIKLKMSFISSNAGLGESTGDFVHDGVQAIIEDGKVIAATEPFGKAEMLVGELRIEGEIPDFDKPIGSEAISLLPSGASTDELLSDPRPFSLDEKGLELALNIQATGLAGRMATIGCKKVVIGISGGLDSTLAVLCAVRAFDMASLPHCDIIGVTMPGFGTSDRTHDNAGSLMRELGITYREIDIRQACSLHLESIGHDGKTPDLCYENSQARERTQILMDLANSLGALVIGTGDLSEIALGWCTYNGDHMSNYAVNASIPKTLVRDMVSHCAKTRYAGTHIEEVLLDIVDTPVSPELTGGNEQQKTEDIVGPYELHDYFIYNVIHRQISPDAVLRAAKLCFTDKYSDQAIEKCLNTFVRRFFTQQFKRSCSPDGPAVTAVSLSPRYGWQMASDSSSALWKNFR